jgi:hypothetical protein
MMVAVLPLAPSLEVEAQATQTTLAPSDSTASIANAATNITAGFAPKFDHLDQWEQLGQGDGGSNEFDGDFADLAGGRDCVY